MPFFTSFVRPNTVNCGDKGARFTYEYSRFEQYSKKQMLPFSCLLLILIVTACGDGSSETPVVIDPPVNIAFNFQSKGQLVTFQVTQPSDLSLSDTVQWEFGDGNQSNDPQPVHYFAEAGTYEVTARLTDRLMRETVATQSLAVAPLTECGLDWQANLPPSFAETSGLAGGEPGFVMVGARGKLRFSQNGFDWCEVATSRGESFVDVHWHNGIFRAFGMGTNAGRESGVYSVFLESSDGYIWETTFGPNAFITQIESHENRLLAIGQNLAGEGSIYAKDQGEGWREVFRSEEELVALVPHRTGFLLYSRTQHNPSATNADGFWTSQDGLNWKRVLDFEESIYRPLVSGDGVLVRMSDRLETSSDGLVWTEVQVNLPEDMINLRYEKGLFVAHGTRFVMVSPDGSNWETIELPEPLEPHKLNLAWNDHIWLITNESGPIFWSADGYNWQPMPVRERMPNRQWSAVTAHDQGFLVGGFRLVEGGILYGGFVLESSDGKSWSETMVESGFAVNDVIRTPHGLMAAGSNDIFSSYDGSIFLRSNNRWVEVFQHSTPVTFIKQLGNKTLAFTSSGQILETVNGQNWQSMTFQVTPRKARILNGLLWILDDRKRLWQTESGNIWEQISLPARLRRPFDLAYLNGTWIVVGDDGDGGRSTFATSTDFREWTFFQLPFATSYTSLAADDRGVFAFGTFTIGSDGEAKSFPHASLIFSENGSQWSAQGFPTIHRGKIATGPQGAVVTHGNRIYFREPPTSEK